MSTADEARNLSVPFDCLPSGCWLELELALVLVLLLLLVPVLVLLPKQELEPVPASHTESESESAVSHVGARKKPKHEKANHKGENAAK